MSYGPPSGSVLIPLDAWRPSLASPPGTRYKCICTFCPSDASTLSAPFRRPLGCPASRAVRCLQQPVGAYSDCTANVAEEGLVALLAQGINYLLLGHLPHRAGFVQSPLTFRADAH